MNTSKKNINFSAYKFIVITPVFEDLSSFTMLLKELTKIYENSFLILAVDDGSITQPLSRETLIKENVEGIVLKLKRNVGHQKAISIGMSHAAKFISNDHKILIMDSDGEDIPKSSKILFEALDEDFIDIAVAKRKNRIESNKFKIFYFFYKIFFRFLTGKNISFGNFMALKPAALHRLLAMQELPTHIAATVITSKLRLKFCSIDRGPRYEGSSKMNFVNLVLHGFKAIMIFTENVLIRTGIACGLIATFSILGIIAGVLLKTFGFATPGWFSIALGILVLIFLQTGAITLISLLLTGVTKSQTETHETDYEKFIESVLLVLNKK